MGRGGDHVGIRHRIGVQPGGDQPGDVRHIDHKGGAHFLGYRGDFIKIEWCAR